MWDGVWFEWLTLPEAAVADKTNARSCVLRVVTANQALLVPADIGHKEEALLLARYGEALHSTVLVLGHHGSTSSNSSAWLNTVAPKWAIASSGFQNSYQHPTSAVQNRLQAHGIALYRTDLQGASTWLLDDALHKVASKRHRPWWRKKPFEP